MIPMTNDEPATSLCWTLQAFFSMALLIFSTIIVMAVIFVGETQMSSDVHPALAFVLFWISMIGLALTEGVQPAMVGLPPIDRSLYKRSHTMTYTICDHIHEGDNLDRFLMGRQFMVLVFVFVINLSGAPMESAATVLSFPDMVSKIFLDSGLALTLMTAMIAQLPTQINATFCMLDFMNDWTKWLTIQLCLAIEASGIVHAAYLIQIAVCAVTGLSIESNEPPRQGLWSFFFWARVFMSSCLLIIAFAVTIVALFDGKTTAWESVPSAVSLFLFFFLMCMVGILEGLQIAVCAVANVPEEQRCKTLWAARTCSLLFDGDGRNLPGFMVGRQLAVVSCFFVIARITTMEIEAGESNVLNVSDPLQRFFDTGLLGALITTIVASLAWQLVAAAYPIAFISNPFAYTVLSFCLLLESTGICHGAWVLSAVHRELSSFHDDEYYVGTAEERAAMQHRDKDKTKRPKKGGLSGGAFPKLAAETHGVAYLDPVAPILINIKAIQDQIANAPTAGEKERLEAALEVQKTALNKIRQEQATNPHQPSEVSRQMKKTRSETEEP